MRNQRAGQATFIPLDTIQHKNDAVDKFRSIHKGARLAIDVIQYEPTVERAMQYACGTSLVCDTEEIAKHIRYTKNLAVKGELSGSLHVVWPSLNRNVYSRHARRHRDPQERSHHRWTRQWIRAEI
jgi:hypothetical protein